MKIQLNCVIDGKDFILTVSESRQDDRHTALFLSTGDIGDEIIVDTKELILAVSNIMALQHGEDETI